MPAKDSRRIADVLAGAARLAFARMRVDPMNADPTTLKQNVKAFSDELVLSLFASLNDVLDAQILPAELREPAVDAYIDAGLSVRMLREDRGDQLFPFLKKDIDWMAPYRAMLRSEGVARAMLKMPAPEADFEERDVSSAASVAEAPIPDASTPDTSTAAKVDALSAQLAAIADLMKPKVGPLFSSASDAYVEAISKAKGAQNENVYYYRNVSAAFIAICGDRPVSEYGETDIQSFVNEISYLPPNFTKFPSVRDGEVPTYEQVKIFIEANREKGGRGLALGTIMDGYVGRVRAVINSGCRSVRIPSPLQGIRILPPSRAARPVGKRPIDMKTLSDVIAAGVDTGLLADALLPALGLLTGRRIGALAYLRRESIQQINDVWMAFPTSHHEVDGVWIETPYKTDESLTGYVLHPIFKEIGFTAWATKKSGYVFDRLMEAKDPADAAQKRMGRLFDRMGLGGVDGTFHALRGEKIAHDRSVKVPARLIRAQAGHELGDVHDTVYGGLAPDELRQMRDVPLPMGIDWSVLRRINFEKFALKRATGGRPKGALGKKNLAAARASQNSD